MRFSRRTLLLGASAAGTLLLAGCTKDAAKQAAGCADADSLTDQERSLRTSMSYTDVAPNAAEACDGCAFFHASETAPGCGRCDILLGAVDAEGHCQSWSRKG
jgi:outer membrane murein-binding lipoprotein Lpp